MEKDKEKENSALSLSANCDSQGASVKLEISDTSVAMAAVVTTGCVAATYIYTQQGKK